MSLTVIILTASLAVTLLWRYILGPFVIWRKGRIQPVVTFDTLEAHELPSKILQVFESQVTALKHEGFSLVAYLRKSDRVTTFLALMANHDSGDVAVLIDITAGAGAESVHTSSVEFGTEYTDGLEILTNSSSQVSVFRKTRARLVFKFPEVRDPRALYAIHRRLLAAHRSRSNVVLAVEGGEIQELARSIERDVARQESHGYYYLDPVAAVYRPTFKGAVLMTWRVAWPGSVIRRALEQRASAAALKRTFN